jgi:hypothetical protein
MSYGVNIWPIKEVMRLLLTKLYSFNLKLSKLQSSNYRHVSTDPLGTGCGSLEIRGVYFGNLWVMVFEGSTSSSYNLMA